MTVGDQDEANEHYLSTHDIIPAKLNKKLAIKVDPNSPFLLSLAQNIESVSTDKHYSILHSCYTNGVASAILSSKGGKENADLFQEHSDDFLKEVKAATSQQFFPRFMMRIGGLLDATIDLEHAFTIKWSVMEAAFYEALGADSAVKHIQDFYTQGLNFNLYSLNKLAETQMITPTTSVREW